MYQTSIILPPPRINLILINAFQSNSYPINPFAMKRTQHRALFQGISLFTSSFHSKHAFAHQSQNVSYPEIPPYHHPHQSIYLSAPNPILNPSLFNSINSTISYISKST
jgi:hypothetical protein